MERAATARGCWCRKDFRWRAGGPAKKAYARRVMDEFLQARASMRRSS